MMSLVSLLAIVAIACMVSWMVDYMPDMWHLVSPAPVWLTGFAIASIISWLIKEP